MVMMMMVVVNGDDDDGDGDDGDIDGDDGDVDDHLLFIVKPHWMMASTHHRAGGSPA